MPPHGGGCSRAGLWRPASHERNLTPRLCAIAVPATAAGKEPVDRRLVVGSGLFGVGWGIAGICPGPALVGAGMGLPKMLLFVGAMLAGMLLFEAIEQWRRKQAAPQTRAG